ncbi:synaptobrevin-B [Clostridium sp. MCC353]
MFNFSNKRTKKIVSSVIIILLVLAMIIPTLAGAFSMM